MPGANSNVHILLPESYSAKQTLIVMATNMEVIVTYSISMSISHLMGLMSQQAMLYVTYLILYKLIVLGGSL